MASGITGFGFYADLGGSIAIGAEYGTKCAAGAMLNMELSSK